MESFRPFQAAVASRSLVLATLAASGLALFGHMRVPALALFAGTIIGLAYLFHIATSFNRLTKGGRRYLPFLTIESVFRVLVAGIAPFIIVGGGPPLGYVTYFAGFVAPLAVAILVFKQQIVDDRTTTGAAN
jgi:hypothetical protein